MKFEQLYSSSRGNLYVVTASNGERLLIECGVTWPKLLSALNHDLSGIVGCLVSHEHKDHSKAVEDVMQAGIDVYSSEYTFEALGVRDNRRAKVLPVGRYAEIAGFEVLRFSISHDAQEPIGFTIAYGDECMLFATDTSHIRYTFRSPFNIIAIECSYDKEILTKRVAENDINEVLAKRLLTSHMEKSEAMRYIADFCNISKCHEIHLLHLSGDNLNKRQTRKEFEDRFLIDTVIV